MPKLTQRQRDALLILRDWKGRPPTANFFAREFWPAADERWKLSWNRVHNCGAHNGATRGAPMWMNAGTMLWRLERKGLAQPLYAPRQHPSSALEWIITPAGKEALNA